MKTTVFCRRLLGLQVLVVRSNFLTGTVDLRACVNILLLDITVSSWQPLSVFAAQDPC